MAAKAGKREKTTVQSADKKRPRERSAFPPDSDEMAQEQKEERLAHLASFPEMNPNPIVEVNVDGSIRYLNPAARKLFSGHNKTELQQIWIGDLNSIREILEKKKRKDSFSREVQIGHRWFRQTIHQTPTHGSIRIYAFDITERKQAEEALRRAHDTLEIRVQERTAELLQANKQLKEENAERLRTEQSLRLEEARLDALLQLSQMSEAPLDEITGFTLEQAIALTQSKIGFVGFLNEEETIYTLHSVSKDVVKECAVAGDPVHWPVLDAGIWADAIRGRKTLFVNDYKRPHPRKKGIPAGHVPIERFMIVPIFEGKRIAAAAGVGNKVSDYVKSDERQVSLLLSRMWSSVQKSRAREELQKAHDELEEKVRQRTAELTASNALLKEEITERKRAEADLRQSQKNLERAQAVGQIGWWRLDVERNVLTWSDENHRIFGIPAGTPLTYETFLNTVHPEDREYVDRQWQSGLRGEPYDVEHRIVVDGQVKWVREKAYLEFDDTGTLLGGFGITQDITERKQAEEALRESKAQIETVVESLTEGMVVATLDGRLTHWNRAALEMHGFASHAEAERMLPEFADTFELASATGEILPVDRWPLGRILRGEVLHNLEIHIRRHNSDWQRVWSYGGRLAQDESGNPFLAVVSVTDITERKRMEEALLTSRDELEKRVQERTAELRSVVEALQDEMAERKQAEETAKAERQRFHDVLETLPAYICLLTPDYYMPLANKVFRNRFGYYPDKKCYEFLFGRSEPCEDCETYKVLKTNAPHHWEWIGPDNRNYDIYDFPFGDTDGSPLIMEMGIDITERKQAEEALKAASLYTRSLIEASLDPLVTISPEGKVTDVNKTAELVTGISRDRLIGSDFSDYFTEPEKAREGYRTVFEKGSVRDYPLAIRHTSGHTTDVLYNATVYKNEAGEVQGVFAAARDITAQKTAEQERLRLMAAIEQSSESVVITDDTGAILYANPAFGRINDYLPREAIGKNYFDILTGDGRDKGPKRKLADILGKARMWKDHFSREKKDGTSYELDVSISPVQDQSGKIINYSIIERDVTRETILEQHLRQQQKMEALGTLAGGIAHDFNNILMPIMINTELSLYDTPRTSPINQYLNTVLEAAQRGQELVNQIITFSRQKEQERKPIKLTSVIKEALRFLRATVSQNIELRENIDVESGMILGDPTQIHQVLMNLCSNAAYAMREKGGILEVSLTAVEVDAHMLAKHLDLKPGPYLKLTVSDTGHGMGQDVIKRIFDPFFTTKKTGEGTGMGLAVVHGIVKRHEGTIITYSEVGKGSTFNIFFPRVEGDPKSEAVDIGAIPMGTERILFVDDEEVQVRSGRRLLERLGYSVIAAIDGHEALEVFRSEPEAFDLVITDQSMPRLTGIKLAEKMMRIRPDIPVILCTGFSEGIDGEKARAAGIREFMMKPFSVRQLAETIRRVLDARD